MTRTTQPLETLQDIKQMMERSSRFISLSGLSGVAAGCCALIGAWVAYRIISDNGGYVLNDVVVNNSDYAGDRTEGIGLTNLFNSSLFLVAILTFLSALILSFLFTYLRSRKTNVPLWGTTAKRLMMNVSIPMIVGGIFILKVAETGLFGLIAPACLIFYGLALVNASKYTLPEIRYLGYCQIVLGLVNLWFIGYGLYFWALGFGVLHIIYGIAMWWKYEKA